MKASVCPRSWEVEAAHDQRLDSQTLAAHRAHIARCAQCTQEHRALQQLRAALRVPDASDELVLRRVRQGVLAGLNRQTISSSTSGTRLLRTCLAAAAVLMIATGAFWFLRQEPATPAPLALRLVPDPGARFTHEQRAGLEYVELRAGGLAIDFPRGHASSLLVRVPDGEIRDLGTVFRVVVSGDRTQEIAVQQGAVIFQRLGQAPVVVPAGQVYLSPPQESVPARSSTTPDTRAKSTAIEPLTAPIKAKHTHPHHEAAARSDSAAAELQDAAYLRILALLNEARHAEARVAAQQYLAQFPHGFRHAEVSRIAAQ